jgi:hypothetical protein
MSKKLCNQTLQEQKARLSEREQIADRQRDAV